MIPGAVGDMLVTRLEKLAQDKKHSKFGTLEEHQQLEIEIIKSKDLASPRISFWGLSFQISKPRASERLPRTLIARVKRYRLTLAVWVSHLQPWKIASIT